MLEWGLKGNKFETHRTHCVVSLSQALYPLLIVLVRNRPDMTEKLLTEM